MADYCGSAGGPGHYVFVGDLIVAKLRINLINRNYARLWSGQAVSTVGDYVFDTTLVLWVGTVLAKGRTWAPIAVSGILLAAGLKSAPPEFIGRVIAVFNPVNQMASMLSIVFAGWLAGTVLLGFHATIAGIHFGPIDVIFTGAGILILAASLCGAAALPRDEATVTTPVVSRAAV